MEQQAEQMLKVQAGRLEHYPELKARIEQHLQETLGQQKLVASFIDRLGGQFDNQRCCSHAVGIRASFRWSDDD